MVLLAARRGVIAFFEPFGRLGNDPGSIPASRDAIFRIASITKVLTATALMRLVDDGEVSLHRPVATYIPEFQGRDKDQVQVRHLLTHTSGLDDPTVEKFGEAAKASGAAPTLDPGLHPYVAEYLALRYGTPLAKQPGVEMMYADINFDLAGEIVRRVSGKPLDRFAQEAILRPLGMKDTHYCRVDADAKRRVETPLRPGESPSPLLKILETERACIGSGWAVSTAYDMAIFVQTFLNGGTYGGERILSPASVMEMTRNQIPGTPSTFFEETFPEASWGFGWSVHGTKKGGSGSLYSSDSFEHWGAGGTYIWGDPRRNVVGVYFSAVPWDPEHHAESARLWANDFFSDMVTASVRER
jgi:CubicO group peptidase (beta-lactamase class C family)